MTTYILQNMRCEEIAEAHSMDKVFGDAVRDMIDNDDCIVEITSRNNDDSEMLAIVDETYDWKAKFSMVPEAFARRWMASESTGEYDSEKMFTLLRRSDDGTGDDELISYVLVSEKFYGEIDTYEQYEDEAA